MTLEGKTISRDDGDLLFFTDGTALRITSDDGHYIETLDKAETQDWLHAQQGFREQQRLRRLQSELHPIDQLVLQRQREDDWNRRYEASSSMGQMMMQMERDMIWQMRQDIERTNRLFFGDPA